MMERIYVDGDCLVINGEFAELSQVVFLGAGPGWGMVNISPLAFEFYAELPLDQIDPDIFPEAFFISLSFNLKPCFRRLKHHIEALEAFVKKDLPLNAERLYKRLKALLTEERRDYYHALKSFFAQSEEAEKTPPPMFPSLHEVSSPEDLLTRLSVFFVAWEKRGRDITDFFFIDDAFNLHVRLKKETPWTPPAELLPQGWDETTLHAVFPSWKASPRLIINAVWLVYSLSVYSRLSSCLNIKQISLPTMGKLTGMQMGVFTTSPDSRQFLHLARVYCCHKLRAEVRRRGYLYRHEIVRRLLQKEEEYFERALREVFPGDYSNISPSDLLSNLGMLVHNMLQAFNSDYRQNWEEFKTVCSVCGAVYRAGEGKLCQVCYKKKSVCRQILQVADSIGLKGKVIRGELSPEEREALFQALKQTKAELYHRRSLVDEMPRLIHLYALE